MSFTVLNMGRRDFSLTGGSEICTVLLFRLPEAPHRSYRDRGPHPATGRKTLLDRLSRDFLDITDRANELAEKAVSKAQLRITSWQVWVPLAVAALALLGTAGLNVFPAQRELQHNIDVLESRMEVGVEEKVTDLEGRLELADRLTGLEERLDQLEVEATQTP